MLVRVCLCRVGVWFHDRGLPSILQALGSVPNSSAKLKPKAHVKTNKQNKTNQTEKLHLCAIGGMDFYLGNERPYPPALEAGLLTGWGG